MAKRERTITFIRRDVFSTEPGAPTREELLAQVLGKVLDEARAERAERERQEAALDQAA